ncbi:MAG: monovalent cation/H+ antiporter complex subunit F [Solirubrobacterales bacterium]
MNEWGIAALVLFAVLAVCLILPALFDPIDGLIALEIAGTTGTAILLLLAEFVHRQSFVDLALIFAPLSLVGALVFVRLLERGT